MNKEKRKQKGNKDTSRKINKKWLFWIKKTDSCHLRTLPSKYTFHFYACMCVCVKSLQSCPTLCGPRDCSPLGFSVFGISQARILE